MRFLDSSVFLHAYLAPRRRLSQREAQVKERAKSIIERKDAGSEEVLTTVIHVTEIANIVEARLGLQTSLGVAARILSLENIRVAGVTEEDYEKALATASRYTVSLNDALAYIKMIEHGVEEVYTFDKHFKNLPGIKIVQE